MFFLVKVLLLAKLHFIQGVKAFMMPRLLDAKTDLDEESLMYQVLELTEEKVRQEYRSTLEKLD